MREAAGRLPIVPFSLCSREKVALRASKDRLS